MQSRAVRWLTLALEDLHDIAAYLAERHLDAAKEVAQCIWNAGQSLAVLSSRGRAGRVAGTRELVLTGFSYFIAYRVVKSEVQILRVLHTARRYPS
ncbi:MAG: type II toxin-antitoxin system RelE/ParE family toxin [Desulfovibrio sp.]|uniref:type II toxin-antitoxin system RelE/ParE family toxin n=1 Tax=Desulfovibrio sp. TaxID=885 RepID=UPI002A35F756|nr:type II toxin-antitoxin system RelE/ParE family toxin [Desulfovibrio sp.]MDY0258273.1 type II toxin-antitoxin system RelE/ParE family toxin [Desulfovibrio sp.]